MLKKKSRILTSAVFLMSIALLLLNDFFLKAQYHNWVTGKLSDFAGLFAFGIVLSTFFSKKFRIFSLIISGIFFCWWKSPLSDSAIIFWNNLSSLQISRIVDYTDLLALTVLLFIPFIYKKRIQIKYFKISPLIIVPIIAFSFISTSSMRMFTNHKFKDEELEMKFNYSKKDLTQMLLKLNGKSLNDYITDSLAINQHILNTFQFRAYTFAGLKNYSGDLAENELIIGDFVIKPVNLKKSKLIFYNTYVKCRSHKKYHNKKIFKYIRKSIKNELIRMDKSK